MSKGAQIALGAMVIATLLGWYSYTALEGEGSYRYYKTLEEFRADSPEIGSGSLRLHGYVALDSIDRNGTGASFAMISGLSGFAAGLGVGEVRDDIRNDTRRLPIALFDTSATVGSFALGTADTRGAQGYADSLTSPIDLGKDGVLHLRGFDHIEATQAKLMEEREIEILRSFGIADPYESDG